MSNKGFMQRGVRYVIDDDALDGKMQQVGLLDEDIDLSTVGDDALIAITGILLKMAGNIDIDNDLVCELIRRAECYTRQMLIDEGIAKAQVESNYG